jgi:hypothetical protein
MNLRALARAGYSAESNVRAAPPSPETADLFQRFFLRLCGELKIDAEEMVTSAISENPDITIDAVTEFDMERLHNTLDNMALSDEQRRIAESSARAYTDEVQKMQARTDPSYAARIKEASTSYYEAWMRKRPNDYIRDSGTNIHAVGHGMQQFQNAAIAFYKGDREAFETIIYRAFAEDRERDMVKSLGAFLTPLRHSLDMFCHYVGVDPSEIVARGPGRPKVCDGKLSYVERLARASGVPSSQLVDATVELGR